jgi:hypothetical protein
MSCQLGDGQWYPVSSQDITVPARPVVESTVVLVVAGRIDSDANKK